MYSTLQGPDETRFRLNNPHNYFIVRTLLLPEIVIHLNNHFKGDNVVQYLFKEEPDDLIKGFILEYFRSRGWNAEFNAEKPTLLEISAP